LKGRHPWQEQKALFQELFWKPMLRKEEPRAKELPLQKKLSKEQGTPEN
jgi:hypothetical protein